MRTICHVITHVVPLAGMGLLLVGLFGGPARPAASAAGVESFESQHDRGAQSPYGYQYPWGQQDSRAQNDRGEYRHDQQALRELGYGLPDRYTIYKGKTCELRCERIRSSREYTCREYWC